MFKSKLVPKTFSATFKNFKFMISLNMDKCENVTKHLKQPK